MHRLLELRHLHRHVLVPPTVLARGRSRAGVEDHKKRKVPSNPEVLGPSRSWRPARAAPAVLSLRHSQCLRQGCSYPEPVKAAAPANPIPGPSSQHCFPRTVSGCSHRSSGWNAEAADDGAVAAAPGEMCQLDAGAAPCALCSALEAMSMSRSARQRATATSEELRASQPLSPSACASFARGAICGTRSRIRF